AAPADQGRRSRTRHRAGAHDDVAAPVDAAQAGRRDPDQPAQGAGPVRRQRTGPARHVRRVAGQQRRSHFRSGPHFTSAKQPDDPMTAEAAKAGAEAPRAKFQDLEERPAAAPTGDVSLDVILDVPVTLSLEVGRARIPIRSLLQLNQGSVVELDRAAGEPLDVYANGTLVAHGEVVVVNEKFGIRLTDVVSPAGRIRELR